MCGIIWGAKVFLQNGERGCYWGGGTNLFFVKSVIVRRLNFSSYLVYLGLCYLSFIFFVCVDVMFIEILIAEKGCSLCFALTISF